MQPAPLSLDSTEDFFLRTLADAGVHYVVIGGHAVNFHGHERPLNDLDIVIERSEENAQRFLAALAQLGIRGDRLTIENLVEAGKKIPAPYHGVDILTSVEPVPFSEMFQESVRVQVGGIEVAVVSRKHLIAQKRLSHRPRDIADYTALLRLQESEYQHQDPEHSQREARCPITSAVSKPARPANRSPQASGSADCLNRG
jgi:hypothetical protein